MLRVHVSGLRRHALQTGQPLAPWLFATRAGTPPEPRNIARAVTRLCRQAGLPRRHSPHDLRHAYATLLVEAGAPLDYVQRQLGHASIQLTIDTYARGAKTKLPRHIVGALDTPHEGTGGAVTARSGDIVVIGPPRETAWSAQVIETVYAPGRNRTCDPCLRSPEHCVLHTIPHH